MVSSQIQGKPARHVRSGHEIKKPAVITRIIIRQTLKLQACMQMLQDTYLQTRKRVYAVMQRWGRHSRTADVNRGRETQMMPARTGIYIKITLKYTCSFGPLFRKVRALAPSPPVVLFPETWFSVNTRK